MENSEKIFKKYGLTEPRLVWPQPNSYDDMETKVKNPFTPLASLIDEAEANPASRGAEFVKEIRQLIIDTRAQIVPIVYPSERTQAHI